MNDKINEDIINVKEPIRRLVEAILIIKNRN